MNRLHTEGERNSPPASAVYFPCRTYFVSAVRKGKDGSMYNHTAFPVIDLAQTGRSIERHRRDAGLTVRDLQTYFGFEYPQAIYKWQHGECLPTVDNLLALARLLQVSMEDLLVYEDQEASHFFMPVRMVYALANYFMYGSTKLRIVPSFLVKT